MNPREARRASSRLRGEGLVVVLQRVREDGPNGRVIEVAEVFNPVWASNDEQQHEWEQRLDAYMASGWRRVIPRRR